MNKQTGFLVSFALVLAALYAAYFTDWFKQKNIQIHWRISPANGALAFYLDKTYPLTSIKVVSSADAKTNKYPHALWHIMAKSSPALIDTFDYGMKVPGMEPEVASAAPEPLLPDTEYSLVIEAGKNVKGEESFTLK